MKFWWVNHNQTFRQEFFGQYIWSPKLKKNQQVNRFYETMREVSPGDVVFSFSDTVVRGFGFARTHAYTFPRPEEFQKAGDAWNEVGWRVNVGFVQFAQPVRPALHMSALAPTLPEKYSPIRANGHGNQGVYLAEIPKAMALVIAQLASPELLRIIIDDRFEPIQATEALPELAGIPEWEDRICDSITTDSTLKETEKRSLLKSRRGQGLFRQRVGEIERSCRVTGVDRLEHLVASHIKPWRESSNTERLERANGLLLTPTIDHLFDRGFISFEGNGELLISPVAHRQSLARMGVPTEQTFSVGSFIEPQKAFLEHHRTKVFLKSLAQ